MPDGVNIDDIAEPIEGRWIRNSSESSGRTILYFHGGAFILRLPKTHSAFVAGLCAQLDASAFMPWYRLAPENPFPAAPEDCLSAYRYLLDHGCSPLQIIFMGDSSGGNLALSALHLAKCAGLPMPGAAVAFSPITDFAQISATWRLNTWRDPMYVVQGAVQPQRHYLQGASPIDPVASPYYGDLADFPPTLLVVGGLEALLDDSVSFVKKALDEGVEAVVHIWKGMPHVFLLYELLPETRLARQRVAEWIRGLRGWGGDEAPRVEPTHRSRVEVFDLQALFGRLRRETNDAYLTVNAPS